MGQSTMFITQAEAEYFAKQLPYTVTAFMKCVDLAPNGCWIWNKTKTKAGYGQINRGKTYAHRWAWDFFRGPIHGFLRKNQLACHDCPGGDNPSCVNPNHLFPGTSKDNAQDASRKGSFKNHGNNFGERMRGVDVPGSKLTEDQVREIRRLKRDQGLGIIRLRRMFGVSHGCIQRILNGKGWRHVK